MPEVNLEDPTAQKMFEAFKKLTMHQFWKKVKGAVKEQGALKRRPPLLSFTNRST